MPTPLAILIRVFVEVQDDRGAQRAAKQLVALLSQFGNVVASPVQKYWKISEYYEVRLRLEPDQDSEDLFPVVVRSLGSGWSTGGTTWKVWNADKDAVFAVSDARWAQVEILE